MKQWRVSGLVLACLFLSGLVLVAAPAEAKGMNLHRGSHGTKVRVLETRLARLSMLPSSAVNEQVRTATVHAVRKFQWRVGLRVTGRVNQRTWNAVRREPARRAAIRAPRILGHRGETTSRGVENTLAAMRVRRAARRPAGVRPRPHGRPRAGADARPDPGPDDELQREGLGVVARRPACPVHGPWRADPDVRRGGGVRRIGGRAHRPRADERVPEPERTRPGGGRHPGARPRRPDMGGVQLGKHLVSLRGLAPQLRLALVSRAIPAVGTVRAAKASVVAVRLDLLNLPRVRRYHSARIQVWGTRRRPRRTCGWPGRCGCRAWWRTCPRWRGRPTASASG